MRSLSSSTTYPSSTLTYPISTECWTLFCHSLYLKLCPPPLCSHPLSFQLLCLQILHLAFHHCLPPRQCFSKQNMLQLFRLFHFCLMMLLLLLRTQLPKGETGSPTIRIVHSDLLKEKLTQYSNALKLYEQHIDSLFFEQFTELYKISANVNTIAYQFKSPQN